MKFKALLALPILALALSPILPAQADTGSSNAYIYNNPRPNASSPVCGPNDPGACSLANRLIADINATSCTKGRIDLLLYSAGNYRIREAVVAKAKCGTKVRLITSRQKPDGEDEGVEPSEEMGLLIKQLKALKQPVTLGWGALSAGGAHGKNYAKGKDSKYIEHEKVVAIDQGNGNQIVESDSGNWTYSLDTDYNDRMRVIDKCLYKDTIKHMDLLAKDRYIKKESPAKSCNGKRLIYWMPTTHTDPVLNWLKKANCGTGDRINFAPFYYAGGKASDYTNQAIRLKKKNVDVRFAANSEGQHWSTVEKRRLVSAGIPVYYMTTYVNDRLKYNHRKNMSAIGCNGGPVGSQGSTTTTKTAFEKNGNQLIWTRVSADVYEMQKGFDVMVGNHKRLNLVDVGCATYDSKKNIVLLPKNKRPSGCAK